MNKMTLSTAEVSVASCLGVDNSYNVLYIIWEVLFTSTGVTNGGQLSCHTLRAYCRVQ